MLFIPVKFPPLGRLFWWCSEKPTQIPCSKDTGNYLSAELTTRFVLFLLVNQVMTEGYELMTAASVLCESHPTGIGKARTINFYINPYTPKSDQYQINYPCSLARNITSHIVWRTWLFIAYSDKGDYTINSQFSLLNCRGGQVPQASHLVDHSPPPPPPHTHTTVLLCN